MLQARCVFKVKKKESQRKGGRESGRSRGQKFNKRKIFKNCNKTTKELWHERKPILDRKERASKNNTGGGKGRKRGES